MGDDLIAVGGRLTPARLESAYRSGLFPMRVSGLTGPLGWWSPDPRGILPLDSLVVSRSLRRSLRRYQVEVDRRFDDVMACCARTDTPEQGWIGEDFRQVYSRLHRAGTAHSVEVLDDTGDLVGGLYGVGYGGLFAGESMFSRRPDASKVALVALVTLLRADGDPRRLLDVQWVTPHLATLGAIEVPRERYRTLLRTALQCDAPVWGLGSGWPPTSIR